MIRTMQAIGIAAIALAGLVLASCVRTPPPADSAAIHAPTALERFRQTNPDVTHEDTGRTAPLIQQARAFALYLNPPAAPPPMPTGRTSGVASTNRRDEAAATAEVRPPSSSPKFELHGISYYRADPDRSMAMICEPGGTRRWVRPGDRLAHILIERIENDRIIYRDGTQSQTMALASSEAIQRFARQAENDRRTEDASGLPAPSAPAPPPVRGMRQIPLSRVAAKLGLTLRETRLPHESAAEIP